MKVVGARATGDIGSISEKALGQFIYIIGTARGGTSILRDALGTHDQILVLPNMTHFMNQVWRYRSKVHERLLRQILRLPRFYHETEVFADLEKDRSLTLQKYIRIALKSGDLKLMWQIYPLVYGLDKGNTKDPKDILAWADKANDLYKIGEIERFFPKGKFIFIVRDPRGSVSSLAKKMAIKENFSFEVAIEDAKVIEASISWCWMTAKALSFERKHPDKSLLVRLEDFLSAPEDTLNRIFTFCVGRTLPDDMIRDRLSGLRYRTSHSRSDSGKGLSHEPVDRWKMLLSRDQEMMIRMLTARTASKAGYLLQGEPPTDQSVFGILRMVPSLKRRMAILAKFMYLKVFEAVA